MAQVWDISRADQDAFALESHRKAAEAYRSGYMDDLVTPFSGVFRDNNIREDATLEKLATLKTAFDKSERGTLTAANSTPLTDGAAAVLLASEEWAAKRGLPVLAYLTYSQTAANDFVGGDGLLMAPTIAVSKMLDRAGLKLQDFDLYEIHEAFAAQVLSTLKAWEDPAYCKERLGKPEPLGSIDRAKLNVKGSSIAFGHPFAATGARIVANLAKLLSEQRRARPHLHLHGGRHGRRRDHGDQGRRRDAPGRFKPFNSGAVTTGPRQARRGMPRTRNGRTTAGAAWARTRTERQLEAARGLAASLAPSSTSTPR